jgi:hypothetical protein
MSHYDIIVFVSSVFRDMHEERDLLNRFVFPEVQEILRTRGHPCTLQWIDLRWGLDTSKIPESERELQILQVCLEEIERSKPLFLCLLGQAYGTQVSRQAIERLTKEFDIDLPETGNSVTAIEIHFALALAALDQVTPLFLSRESANGTLADEPGMAAQKLAISRRLPESVWRYTREDLGDAKNSWSMRVTPLLAHWIEVRLPSAQVHESEDPISDYRDAFDMFRREIAAVFVGREIALAELVHKTIAATQGPQRLLALRGNPGQGKTSLTVRLVDRLEATYCVLVLHHFVGLRPDGASVDAMLRRFCDQLCDALSRARLTDEAWTREGSKEVFVQLLEAAAAKHAVVFVVDTPEDMEPSPAGRLLTWWPRKIVGRAALLVTCRDAVPVADAWALPSQMVEELAGFTPAEARSLVVTLCERRHRRLPDAVLDAILAKSDGAGGLACTNPLWITLLVEELNLLEAHDFLRTHQFPGSGSDRIEHLLHETVADAPHDAIGLFSFVFARMERSLGRSYVAQFASLLALSRSGLRPSDIEALWAGDLATEQLAGVLVSPLTLSQLRHRLRAQVSTSGPAGAWRLTHMTSRQAALESGFGQRRRGNARPCVKRRENGCF